jgi:hypothetical protein
MSGKTMAPKNFTIPDHRLFLAPAQGGSIGHVSPLWKAPQANPGDIFSRPFSSVGRGLGPRSWAREEALEKHSTLFLVSFRSRLQECIANLGHAAAFASSNDFQISLEIRSNSKRESLVFFH